MDKPSVLHSVMLSLLGRLAGALQPYAERVQIVGSVRRGDYIVGDGELLIMSPRAELFDVLERWKQERRIQPRKNRKGNNIAWSKYSQRSIDAYDRLTNRWYPVDLFFTEPEGWALSELIRTGDKDFSRMIVSYRSLNGVLPDDLRYQGWRLWSGETPLHVETEADVFRMYGLPFILPYERDGKTLKQYDALRARAGNKRLTLTDLLEAPPLPPRYRVTSYNRVIHWTCEGSPVAAPSGLYRANDGHWYSDGTRVKIPDPLSWRIEGYLSRPVSGSVGLWVNQPTAESLVYYPPDRDGYRWSQPMAKIIEWARKTHNDDDALEHYRINERE